MLAYNFTETKENGMSVNILFDFRSYPYTEESHTSFYELLEALRDYSQAFQEGKDLTEYKENVASFLRPEYSRQVLKTNEKLTEKDGEIYYGDNRISGEIVERILTFKRKGIPFLPLWNFLEKLMLNPDARSREQLYTFIESNPFPPLSVDGDILAYKKVKGDWTSVHRGYGIVNGVIYENANLDNSIGNVVTMPRDKVNADPEVGCSYGLHVGSLEYVSSFSGEIVVIVKVDPKDVVSVPKDASYQKIRVCKYEVVAEFDGNEIKEEVVSTYDAPALVEESYTTAEITDEAVASKMRELLDKDVRSKYHLANRYANSTGLTLTPKERQEMVERYSTIAEKVLEETAIQELVTLIDNNVDTLFPCDNEYHFAARVMNINLGRHNWTIAGNNEDYSKFVVVGEAIKHAKNSKDFNSTLTKLDWYNYSGTL